MDFGEQLQSRVIALDHAVLEDMKRKHYTYTDAFLKEIGRLEGCTDSEIDEIMKMQGVTYLPPVFREYLRLMGKNAGRTLFAGGDYRCKDLVRLKRAFQLALTPAIPFPDDAFVFLSYQGTVYYFFHAENEIIDPAVYQYLEETQRIEQVSEHLSDWFYAQTAPQYDEDD